MLLKYLKLKTIKKNSSTKVWKKDFKSVGWRTVMRRIISMATWRNGSAAAWCEWHVSDKWQTLSSIPPVLLSTLYSFSRYFSVLFFAELERYYTVLAGNAKIKPKIQNHLADLCYYQLYRHGLVLIVNVTFMQCCRSGSGIRSLFVPWIWNRFFRIPDPKPIFLRA